jgi:hypothetical protein
MGQEAEVDQDGWVASKKPLLPKVGMGATILDYTDRTPATIIRVSDSAKTFWIQQDNAKRIDNNGMSEDQVYIYSPNLNANIQCVRLTKKGWQSNGQKVVIGIRRAYYDYSF